MLIIDNNVPPFSFQAVVTKQCILVIQFYDKYRKKTFLMTIVVNEGLNLKRLVLNKRLQELLIKSEGNKSIVTRWSQPFGNSLGEDFASEDYPQPGLPGLPSGNFIGQNSASGNQPHPKLLWLPSQNSIRRNFASEDYP